MPSPPALLGGAMVVLFAFLLGRCTAGDGNDVTTEPTNTTAANPVTTTSQYSVLHVVQENETLAAIAAKYGVTVEAIAIANNIGNTNNIFVGQELKIPPTTPNTTTTTTTKKQGK